MATFYLSPISTILQAFTNQGVVLAGGSITTYAAGTTTPTDTWTDITGVTKNSNPILLDAAGRTLNGVMIWQQSRVPIKAIFKDASGVQIGPTFDQISGVGDPGSALISFWGGTDTGAANAYALTVASANFTSYADGITIEWVVGTGHTNTGSSTVNVNGLGAVSLLYPDGSALVSQELAAGQIVTMVCSGGNFYVTNSSRIPRTAYKTSDTSRASTTTLAADPHLTFSMPTNLESAAVEGLLLFQGNASSGAQGIKIGLFYTNPGPVANPRMLVSGVVNGTATQGVTSWQATATSSSFALSTVSVSTSGDALSFKGVVAGAQGGNIGVSWAQNGSSTNPTTMLTGSWLRITR